MTQQQMIFLQEIRRRRRQQDFEVIPRARKDDPDTSYEAAEKIVKTGHCLEWYRKIYKALRDNERPQGWTAKEIAWLIAGADWKDAYGCVWRRLGEMVDKGFIIRSRTGRKSQIGTGTGLMCRAELGKEKELGIKND